MKILLLNGSPRRGNTYTALEVLKRSFANIPNAEVSQIDTNKVEVASCIACEYCKKHGKCFVKDDTNAVIDAIVSADVLIFATPVYWWGISSQLKAIIDKFYSRQQTLLTQKKKLGSIVSGQLSTDNAQYAIILKQSECICDYLGWDYLFCKTYSVYEKDDMKKNETALSELGQLWKKIAQA